MFDRKRLAPQLAKTFNFMEGGVGIFGFGYLFLVSTKKRRFFRFGVCCGLRLLLYFDLGFQFSAKIKSGF